MLEFTSCQNERKKTSRFLDSYLKRDIRVEFEGGNSLTPRLKLFRIGVNVVVKDCSLAREFDRFELVHPCLLYTSDAADE